MSKIKFSPKEILKPTVILLVICVVAAALLAGTNMLTKDKIAEINAETKAQAMQTVMPDAVAFAESVQVGDTLEYSDALDDDGMVIGYAFTCVETGYGGDVQVMIGINTDGSINKVTIVAADDETPGLGQNVKKDSFLDQFAGKSGELTVIKNAVSSDSEIQAVTSATITSKAVTKAVNTALEYYSENLMNGGGANG